VAYTLALEEGIYPTVEQDQYAHLLDPNDPTSFYADGDLQFPNTPLLRDWKVHGLVNIHSSLQVSSDNYYWGIALEIWDRAGLDWDENLLQDWARELGFGGITGVDLPFEQAGIVPDREWFQYHQLNRTGLVRFDGPWSGGDLMNTAIGQGAMVCTPLQLANAYAALVNGGTLWQPYVVSRVVDSEGEVRFLNLPSANRMIDISDETVTSLLADLHGVVASETGTAFAAFTGFGESLDQVGGKTGTAQIRLPSYRVTVDRMVLSAADEVRLIDRLAELLERPVADIRARFETQEVEFSAADDISEATAALIEQNLWDLPGVVVEEVPEVDTAWFVGVAPLDDLQYVVAVVIDGGGSGGKIAAPTTRAILQFLMGEEVDAIRSGEDTD
jgi:cell division protein FtsI/penicillin-binding protein 2